MNEKQDERKRYQTKRQLGAYWSVASCTFRVFGLWKFVKSSLKHLQIIQLIVPRPRISNWSREVIANCTKIRNTSSANNTKASRRLTRLQRLPRRQIDISWYLRRLCQRARNSSLQSISKHKSSHIDHIHSSANKAAASQDTKMFPPKSWISSSWI